MRAIGRALDELIGVLAAGFVGFFVMLAYIAGGLMWFVWGVVCFCFLSVALFSMIMWLLTGDTHAFHLLVGYCVYAGAAYAVIAAVSYYGGRFTDIVRRGHARATSGRIGRRGAAEDADFDSVPPKWLSQ